jgi:hypothetical protein
MEQGIELLSALCIQGHCDAPMLINPLAAYYGKLPCIYGMLDCLVGDAMYPRIAQRAAKK